MTLRDLCLLLRRYGIATAHHQQGCAVLDYKTYTGDDLNACTCGPQEIRDLVKKELDT